MKLQIHNKSEQRVVLTIKVNREKIAISIYKNILDRLEHIHCSFGEMREKSCEF